MTTQVEWGSGNFVRAHNIPEQFRAKICCYCGRIIKWDDQADLREVPTPFSAHGKCSQKREQVSDGVWGRRVEKSVSFLSAKWYGKMFMLFLKLVNGEEL